jgi:hypothetical protein
VYNSIELSTVREANSCATTQEFPNILLNPKVHYRIHKEPSICPYTERILSVKIRAAQLKPATKAVRKFSTSVTSGKASQENMMQVSLWTFLFLIQPESIIITRDGQKSNWKLEDTGTTVQQTEECTCVLNY